jgi:predicted transport protein
MEKRVLSIHDEVEDDIEIRIDGQTFNNDDFNYIRQLPQILADSGDIGSFGLGNLEISINSLETYENNLIVNKEKKDVKN